MEKGARSNRIGEMSFIKKNILVFIGIAIGAIGGFLYWKYVGCISGTCAITSDPINSLLYGSVMGGLLFSMIGPRSKRP